eukprot:TRINITY_DN37663_c0_g1_i1.p1 TRINITY_DN37663_c0_g1~~TRINITY_DN37663_c0_g1_i1.p1  ORF type:complete len:365 (+),score=59.86 TRINITY_DN37663_c0_g1_i1:33-1097(+)
MQELMEQFKKAGIPDVVDRMLEEVFKGRSPANPVGDMCKAMGRRNMEELNKRHGIVGSVRFCYGEGGLVKAVLSHGDGNTAEVYLYGAHVTRWAVDGHDALWMSPDTNYTEGEPIRGGIPLCWPQFGHGDLPLHGFLRTSPEWTIVDTESNENNVCISLQHLATPATLALYNHLFKVTYSVHLKPHSLTTSLKVENTGEMPLEFTTAMHNYFSIPHLGHARVEGLAGVTYTDKLKDFAEFEEKNSAVSITEPTDRIYADTPSAVGLNDGCFAKVDIHKSPSLPDVVVWNPGAEKALAMRDFNNFGWNSMLCVESGAIKGPISLKRGEAWYGSQTLSVEMSPTGQKEETCEQETY